ncbi:hypothetical protein CCB80_02090 [Armatimonadetes bacterium Uphvl-Ar1]|nr:hypothetical protein CCB80_02090 [Armatimonadetes bacterium Uphvl-Ar1]
MAGLIVLAVVCFVSSIVSHLYLRRMWIFWMSFFTGSTEAKTFDEEWKESGQIGEWSAPILFSGFLFMQGYFLSMNSGSNEKLSIIIICSTYLLSVIGVFVLIARSRAESRREEVGSPERSNPKS